MNNNDTDRPIGVFDSGVGGLTVAAAIQKSLPGESIVYLGDLLHLPYGSKSEKAVLEFTRAAVNFLLEHEIKLLVIACNTATSVAKHIIEKEIDIPVIGVIEPGAKAACNVTKNRRIGVIGTTGTIKSGAYVHALKNRDDTVSVFQKDTPLLVPLIEEGWTDHPVLKMVLEEYFTFFHGTYIDTLVLGCTHYPLIRHQIQEVNGSIRIVDSAETTADAVKNLLVKRRLVSSSNGEGGYEIFLTDYTDNFRSVGEMILQQKLDAVSTVTLHYSNGRVMYGENLTGEFV